MRNISWAAHGGRIILYLAALGLGPAHADVVLVDIGASYRGTTAIDLAEVAGADGYGAADDTSPGALGLRLGLGYRLEEIVELWVDGRLGVGGLALDHTETRYFGQTDTIGGSASLEAGVHALFPFGGRDFQWLVGPGGIYHLMSASSGVGMSTVRSLGLGARVGVRWRLNEFGTAGSGYLEVDLDAYYHAPTFVRVGSGDVPRFENSQPDEGQYASFGLSVVYGFAFPLFEGG